MPRVNEEELVLEAFGAEVYEAATTFFSANAIGTIAFLLALFAIFAVHQFFLWMSTDPVRAFHLAKILASGSSSVWNTLRVIYNGWVDVETAILPTYNLMAIHVVQPAIFTALDVISLVFTGQEYGGIIKDPYSFQGHVCDGTEASAAWCAIQAKYASDLNIVETEGSNVIQNGTAIVMSTAQARRLQALSGQSLIGSLPIQPLVDIVVDISSVIIMIAGQIADIGAHVVWTLLHEIAVLIYNLAMLLVRAIGSLIMQIFSSGIFQNVLKIGLDILMVLVIHIALPFFLAILDIIMCWINFAMPGTWPEQLRCVEATCFQEDGDLGAEIVSSFSSIPIIAKQVGKAVTALFNPSTGRRFGQASSGAASSDTLGNDINANTPSAAASTCAACFTCRVPEMRALWLLIAMTWGCATDETRFAGRVENRCLDDGSWYVDACGPRTSMLTDSQWALTYLKHREFNTGRCQEYAGRFEQLARDSGGTANGFAAQRTADAWFQRDITAGGLSGPDQAAPFFRRICSQMRIEYPDTDTGPGSTSEAEGSMKYLVGNFLYRECKYMDGFDLCSNPFAMNIVDGWTEIKNCVYDAPACRRERDVCLGNCGGNVSSVEQDFHTFAAKAELSQRVLGTEVLSQGRANCSIRSHTFLIPLFDGMGDAFIAYASRLRVRGGFLAIDPKACQRDPAACAAVHRVLERVSTPSRTMPRFCTHLCFHCANHAASHAIFRTRRSHS